MTHRIFRIFTLLALLVVAGCGSKELLLESKPANPPAEVDFTGLWTLREDADADRRPRASRDKVARSRSSTRSRSSRIRAERSVHLFLEYGSTIKVSQTPYSLFLSYDRAVVEEYTFGENRLITVGPIEAKRVSGWEATTFVVETLDHEGALLIERWSLQSEDVLEREVSIVQREETIFSQKQVFDRS